MEEPKSYSIEKLNESNYRSWSQVVESHLDDQDLWEVVQGNDKKPEHPSTSIPQSSEQAATEAAAEMEEYETKLEAWTKKAKKARKMIISTISASVMTYVEGTKDPAEMWTILEGRYKPKTRVTLRQLQRQFNTMKMMDDDGDMEKHLQGVERLKRQIEEQGEQISDSSYVSVLLNCAPSRYDVQISILEAQDDITSTIIINRLLEEYRKFLIAKPEETKMALLMNQRKSTNQKGGKSKSGRNSSSSLKFNGNCNHCSKRGHKEDQCWIKHPELKPEKSRRDERNERPKFAMMATMGTVAAPKRQSGPHIWYTDSGASDLFSPYRDLFGTFHKLDEPMVIETAEGTVIGTGIGTITITVLSENDIEMELQLNNVVYAPNMSTNLFSLMAAYDKGYETRITPGHGLRVFHGEELVATTIRATGGLFRLKTPTDAFAYAAQVSETTPELDVNIWHRRMGHLGEENIRKLAKMVNGMIIKSRTTVGVYEACLEGKQHRQPSHQPATRAKEPLELIHSDLYGPIDPTTHGGTNYYLLFTDDFTRMTRIYPLKKKSSASILERFREYKPEVEKQTGRVIKRLRTDGGGEYEKWMGIHLKGSGIIHEMTAPYSPDQNGVAERANRTIMERVKAIIAESKLDKRLWMEIAEAVVYLKNRSPTSAVATTPYELWHGTKPSLSHLRIIGSTAYVHVPKEKRIKLDTHSHKGIMIGYGGGTNQYKVWDLTRKDVVVSRDVVFIEGKPVDQTPAVYIEEPRIMYDSITVLPGPPAETEEPQQSDSATPPSEHPDPEEPAPEIVDPGILLQESTTIDPQEPATGGIVGGSTRGEQTQRSSARSNKGTVTSKKFADENFDKAPRVRMAKIARNIDPNDEDEPATVQQAINHPTRGKQWEKAIRNVLAGELEEEIYMEQPEGFEVGTKEDDLVCRLRKSIYGLKQAPRIWNQKIRRFLKSIGFDQTFSDPCA